MRSSVRAMWAVVVAGAVEAAAALRQAVHRPVWDRGSATVLTLRHPEHPASASTTPAQH